MKKGMEKANSDIAILVRKRSKEIGMTYGLLYNTIAGIAFLQLYFNPEQDKPGFERMVLKYCLKRQIELWDVVMHDGLNSGDLKTAENAREALCQMEDETSAHDHGYKHYKAFIRDATGSTILRRLDYDATAFFLAIVEEVKVRCDSTWFFEAICNRCQEEIERMKEIVLVLNSGYTEEEINNIFR